jgi:EAL and modified HD-GYP domain-containing signal transduction protein
MSKIRLMHEVNQMEIDFNKVEEIVKHDVSMSYKLLRYINSAYFGLRAEATSIKQALVFLGVRNLRKWASLMAFACLGEDKPQELLTVAVVRARFCELLAGQVNLGNRSDDLFLMGLFSALDAMLNISMEKVVDEITFAPEIKSALLGDDGTFRHVLDLVLGFEVGEWDEMKKMKQLYNMDELAVPQLYFDAVKTAWEILSIESH